MKQMNSIRRRGRNSIVAIARTALGGGDGNSIETIAQHKVAVTEGIETIEQHKVVVTEHH